MSRLFYSYSFLIFLVYSAAHCQDSSDPADNSSLDTTIVSSSSPLAAKPTRSNVSSPAPQPLVINDAAPVVEQENLVLTASRVVEMDFTAPYVTDSISEAELIERSVRSVPEALEQTPGVIVQKTSHGQGSPIIRGFTGYHTLFLIDGVRLNNSVFRSGPNQYWNTVDSQGLAGIELIKSQGSVIYGSEAVGGTLQALTRRPVYAEEGFHSGGRTFSRYASGENSFIQRGEYSVSEAGQYGFIFGGTYKDFGNIKAADLGVLPYTGYGEWAVDGKAEFFLNDDTRLTFFHQQDHVDDAWRTHATKFGKSWAGATVGTDNARILDQARILSYAQLEGDADHPWFDHYAINVSHHFQDEQEYRERSNGRYEIQGFAVDTYGIWAQFDRYLENTDLTYGVSYYMDSINSFRQDFNANGTPRAPRIQGPVGDAGSYHLAGVFINSSTAITERTRVDFGARYTYASVDIGRVEDPDTGGQISIENNWQNLVGSGRISHQLDDENHYRVFAGVSQSFRAPNLSDLSRFDANRTDEIETPSPNLEPEHFVTYEIGVKAEAGALSGTLSYYYTHVNDLILRSPTGRTVNALREVTKSNSGDGHVQGVELNFNYDLSEQLEIFGGIAYQDSRVTTYPTSAPILKEEVLSRILPTSGFAGARWTPDDRLWFEGLVQVADRADRLNTSDILDTQRIPPGGTPGYSVATIRSGWQATDRVNITSAIENIFDEDYRAHGSGQNEPGINFIFGAEVKF